MAIRSSDELVRRLLLQQAFSESRHFSWDIDPANTMACNNHGGRRGNAAQAFARWRHPLASSEAWDVLHQAMRHTPHHRIHMVIDIASVRCVFFTVLNVLVATTIG